MQFAKKHALALLLAGAVLWWLMTGDVPVVAAAARIIGRGRSLSTSHLTGLDIDEDLADLVAQASAIMGREVSTDAYLSARICASEHPTATEREKSAIIQVCYNAARAHNWTLEEYATGGKGLGKQEGRRCSTSHDPFEADLDIAERTISGQIPNETRGATHFVHQSGFAKVGKTYDWLVDKWRGEMNIVPVRLPGIPNFRLFLSANSYQPEQVLEEIA